MKWLALNFFNTRGNYKWYYALVVLRVILTCLPQTGYIHPDEFFQSIEIVSGDVFKVESNRPWEFNTTFPIRSILVPQLVVGIPYHLLKHLDVYTQQYFNVDLKVPYFLLVFPRLFICLCSFIIDYCLYRLCKINRVLPLNKLVVLASSYVILVYGTRTFSNTVEMILISVLLCLVAECHVYSHSIIKQKEFLTAKYKNVRKGIERAILYKLLLSLPAHSLRHCVWISFITVLGVFNRPTFLAFAFPPVFFWFHRGIGYKTVNFTNFHVRMLAFLTCSGLYAAVFIIIDSFYFGYVSMAEIQAMEISLDNFVVTPFNFIKYNSNVKNLAEHGLHSRGLHILVNVPLLYNVLGVLAMINIGSCAYKLAWGIYGRMPSVHSIKGLMVVSAVSPIFILSYFPHQEPRFLIPTILPIVYLYAEQMCWPKRADTFFKIWFSLNLLCTIFYGFVHQGGVYPLAKHLADETKHTNVHMVSSHIYSVPLSLIQRPSTQTLYTFQGIKYKFKKKFFLQELGSEPLEKVMKRIDLALNYHAKKKGTELYLALPTSKCHELNYLIHNNYSHLAHHTISVYYPHIGTEALPNFQHLLLDENESIMMKIYNFAMNTLSSCGLGLYHFYLKNGTENMLY